MLAERRPEPGYLWIRFWPRSWPGRDGWWVHLGEGRLGSPSSGLRIEPALLQEGPSDVVYLPAVDDSCRDERDRLTERAAEVAAPVLVQLLPGDPSPPPPVLSIYDPLQAVLRRDLDRLDEIPLQANVIWPLIAGLTTDEALWEAACERLSRRQVKCVQAMVLELSPVERRSLVESAHEAKDDLFHSLFHHPRPDARDFARTAHRYGLAPFLPRPLPDGSTRQVENRKLSGFLALCGELWLRMGRSTVVGHGLYQAARWVDDTTYDVGALIQEGNLRLLGWLEEISRRAMEDWVGTQSTALYDELLDEYLGGDA